MTRIRRQKIGLALGSGGPKGLAHIGVIKVLEENNIPIDFIAGSSIGAMVGGFYAATKDVERMEKLAIGTDWKSILSLVDPSLKHGLFAGKKVKMFIESHIDKMHFQDLMIPFSVVATDLKSGEATLIDDGEVAVAVRASVSSPLVFEPVERKDTLLIDGGLSMPVPVSIVKDMGADLVIAVNLDADYFNEDNNENNNFNFYKIASNSINMLRYHLSFWNTQHADVVITPKSGNAHWNKFADGKDIILNGEQATKDQLNKLKKLIQ